jgi:hypothetical protein
MFPLTIVVIDNFGGIGVINGGLGKKGETLSPCVLSSLSVLWVFGITSKTEGRREKHYGWKTR